MIKKIAIFFASLFIGIGLLAWVVKFIGWQEIKSVFSIFAGWHGIVILGLTFSAIISGSWKWKMILKGMGDNVSLLRLLKPYLASFSIMYFVPMIIFGGEIFKGHILKEKYSVSTQRAYASVIIDRILELTVSLLIIFSGSLFFLLRVEFFPKNFTVIFGGILIFFAAAIIFFYFKIFKKESIIKIFVKKVEKNSHVLETEREIFDFFKIKNKFMWRGFALAWLKAAIIFLRTWVLIIFLGKTTGFFGVISILGFYYLALMVPIPAALGSHDVAQVFSFDALGFGANTGAAFTMIIRGAELIAAFIGLILFFKLWLGLFYSLVFKRIDDFIKK